MKINNFFISLSVILICHSSKIIAQIPSWLWAQSTGGSLNDYGQAVANDPSGNVYTVGSFQGTVDLNPGTGTSYATSVGALDILISKSDASGNFLWAKSMGSTNTDEASAVACDDSGNVYITGHFQGNTDFDPGPGSYILSTSGNYDIFICKLNSSGNFIWARSMGGSSLDEGLSIQTDAQDNVYIIGYFSGNADFDPDSISTMTMTSAGGRDIFIAKLNSSGQLDWAKKIGGTGQEKAASLALNTSGDVYLTGYFSSTVDFDPDPVGTLNLTSKGGYDVFVCKFTTTGNFNWAKSMGGMTNDEGKSIAIDASDNIYLTGYFTGTCDFNPDSLNSFNLSSSGGQDIFICKMDYNGNLSWAKQIGGSNNDEGNSIAVDLTFNNGIYSTGYFSGTVDFNPDAVAAFPINTAGNDDIFVLNLDTTGNFILAISAGGSNADYGQGISLNVYGNAYVAGWYSSALISFDNISLQNAVSTGFPDLFVSQLDIISSGIQNLVRSNHIAVFPNPATNSLYISMNDELSSAELTLTDITGKEVFSGKYLNSSLAEINISDYAEGVYLLRAKSDLYSETKRVIICK